MVLREWPEYLRVDFHDLNFVMEKLGNKCDSSYFKIGALYNLREDLLIVDSRY